MPEFYNLTDRVPQPTDVQIKLEGRKGGGKSTLARALLAAANAGHLPGVRLCFSEQMRELILTNSAAYPEMTHPLHVGLYEADEPVEYQVAELAEYLQTYFAKDIGEGDVFDTIFHLLEQLRGIDQITRGVPALEGCATRPDIVARALHTASDGAAAQNELAAAQAKMVRDQEAIEKYRADLANARSERDAQASKLHQAAEQIAKQAAQLTLLRGELDDKYKAIMAASGTIAEHVKEIAVLRQAASARPNVLLAQPTQDQIVRAVREAVHSDSGGGHILSRSIPCAVPINPAAGQAASDAEIAVYLTDGRVFVYTVGSAAKAREHTHAIIQTGYRHVSADEPGVLEHYPPHAILKVKVTCAGLTTQYTDTVRGT